MIDDDLAPMRRVEELLAAGRTLDEVLLEVEMLFGLDFVDAMSAVAAVTLVNERGLPIPAERPTWSRQLH